MMNSSTIFLATTIIIIVISILTTTSGTGTLSFLVFAQTDFNDLTVTDSSENLVDTPGLESSQQQGPIPPATAEQPSEEPTLPPETKIG